MGEESGGTSTAPRPPRWPMTRRPCPPRAPPPRSTSSWSARRSHSERSRWVAAARLVPPREDRPCWRSSHDTPRGSGARNLSFWWRRRQRTMRCRARARSRTPPPPRQPSSSASSWSWRTSVLSTWRSSSESPRASYVITARQQNSKVAWAMGNES